MSKRVTLQEQWNSDKYLSRGAHGVEIWDVLHVEWFILLEANVLVSNSWSTLWKKQNIKGLCNEGSDFYTVNDGKKSLEGRSHKHCFCCRFLVISIMQEPHEACNADSLSKMQALGACEMLVQSAFVRVQKSAAGKKVPVATPHTRKYYQWSISHDTFNCLLKYIERRLDAIHL